MECEVCDRPISVGTLCGDCAPVVARLDARPYGGACVACEHGDHTACGGTYPVGRERFVCFCPHR
jgi:hypothetical protein